MSTAQSNCAYSVCNDIKIYAFIVRQTFLRPEKVQYKRITQRPKTYISAHQFTSGTTLILAKFEKELLHALEGSLNSVQLLPLRQLE